MNNFSSYYVTVKASREHMKKIRKIAEQEERTILAVTNRILRVGLEAYLNEAISRTENPFNIKPIKEKQKP